MVPSLRNGFPLFIARLLDELDQLIGPIHVVGSAVRNVLQGSALSNDLNILTPRPLEKCLLALRNGGHDAVAGGNGDHSLFVPLKGWEKPKTIEISRFRHRPVQTPTIEEDLLHRDITVNAMAYAWPNGPLIDPFNGQGDLTSKRIRLVNGEETLRKDPLRAVRLFRFSLQLAAVPDPEDLHICAQLSLDQVPPERIRVELDRVFSLPLNSQNNRDLLFALFSSNLGEAMLPELKLLKRIPMPGDLNGRTVWHHMLQTLISLTVSPREEDISLLDLRWVVIFAGFVFHAKGLQALQKTEKCGCHDKVIHQIVTILNRYGFSRRRQKKILNILNNLDLGFSCSDRVLKRLLGESVPVEGLIAVIFHWKHAFTCTSTSDERKDWMEFSRAEGRCRMLRRAGLMLQNKDLAISGGDILEMVRRDPGPWLGNLQKLLLNWVVEDTKRNNPESVRKKVLEWITFQEKF